MLWPAGLSCMDGQAGRLFRISPRRHAAPCSGPSLFGNIGALSRLPQELHAAGIAVSVQVLMLVPTAPRGLLPIIADRLPNKAQPRGLHCLYLRAVLQLAQSKAADSLRNGLQSAVVGHLLDLDVEIKWQDIADQAAGQLPSLFVRPRGTGCCFALVASLSTARGRREDGSLLQHSP